MTPQKISTKSSYPPKILSFLKTPKNIEIQNFEPKKMDRAYVCMKISEYPPPPPGVLLLGYTTVSQSQTKRRPWHKTGPGGGGGVLWYIRTYVGSAHFFFGSKFWISIFWGFSEKWIFFGGMKICGFFFGSSQNWASLKVISMQFRVFF